MLVLVHLYSFLWSVMHSQNPVIILHAYIYVQVILGTLATAVFNLDDRYNVPVVGEIPKG